MKADKDFFFWSILFIFVSNAACSGSSSVVAPPSGRSPVMEQVRCEQTTRYGMSRNNWARVHLCRLITVNLLQTKVRNGFVSNLASELQNLEAAFDVPKLQSVLKQVWSFTRQLARLASRIYSRRL